MSPVNTSKIILNGNNQCHFYRTEKTVSQGWGGDWRAPILDTCVPQSYPPSPKEEEKL